MRGLIFILVLISINLFGQKAIYKWQDGMCEYESKYNKKMYTETQLKNCYSLTYNYYFQIDNTPSVFKLENIQDLNLDTLDNEYHTKLNQLKSLDLPKIEYWEKLKKSIIIELKQFYKLSRIAYQSYSNPIVLKEWFYQDSCLNKHTNALVAGGDSLLKNWYELSSILVKDNCCPDVFWREYYDKYNSDKRLDFAKVDVTTFGWWNCAIKHVERSDDKLDWEIKQKEFLKLFIKTKTKYCETP